MALIEGANYTLPPDIAFTQRDHQGGRQGVEPLSTPLNETLPVTASTQPPSAEDVLFGYFDQEIRLVTPRGDVPTK